MNKENLNLVIVGHVDHGKSTLIGRLFYDTDSLPKEKIDEVRKTCDSLGRGMEWAFIMDHLQEEREQGITIDTAQSFFKTAKREYVIIDAPGHVEFVRNMITGASLAEAAILIIDANEGIKEQTKRHAFILSLLGLKQIIVAFNKMDLAGYSQEKFNSLKDEFLKFLEQIGIKPTYLIPIVAKDGDNVAKKSGQLPWYDGPTILEALDALETKKPIVGQPWRYPIQDVYKVGDKRILAGQIESGAIEQGQTIIFLPSHKKTIVESIEVFQKEKTEAAAGENIGITLADQLFIESGEVACGLENLPHVAQNINAKLFWLSPEPLRENDKITLRCVTQEIKGAVTAIKRRFNSATLELLAENADRLANNEVGEVEIVLDQPLVFENFNQLPEMGRFVLVREQDILAGGIIV